ncbi:hypothetical protein BGZ60DRAFT_552530 [Tricladium varicosporioides]|nr:hypothetical protein BGZ60DRAFT_552530 [Hymenoscyphus varicosporioides]
MILRNLVINHPIINQHSNLSLINSNVFNFSLTSLHNCAAHIRSPITFSAWYSRSTYSPVPTHDPPSTRIANRHSSISTYSNMTVTAYLQGGSYTSTATTVYERGDLIPIILFGLMAMLAVTTCMGAAVCYCYHRRKTRQQRSENRLSRADTPRSGNLLHSRLPIARTQTRVTTTTTTRTTIVTGSDNGSVHDEAPPIYSPLALNLPLQGVLDHDDRVGAPPPSYNQRILDQLHDGPTVEVEDHVNFRIGYQIVQEPSPSYQQYWNPRSGNMDQ